MYDERSLLVVVFLAVCLSVAFLLLHFVDRLLIEQSSAARYTADNNDAGAPWVVRDRVEFKSAVAGDRATTLNLRLVDYRRSLPERTGDDGDGVRRAGRTIGYGASYPVSASRTSVRNYARTLLPYRRKNVIYVPSETDDSVRCDEWSQSASGNTDRLVPCTVSDGLEACFRCLESRRYVRQCIHLDRPLTVTLADDATGKELVVPANRQSDEGWCLPAAFKDIRVDDDGRLRPPFDETRNCNPNTGDWILSRLIATDDRNDSNLDPSYNWICRCRYPNLMTNVGDLTSDCMQPVGCRPYGQLDDRSRAGLVDPYRNGTCVCSNGYTPDRVNNVGPVCRPLNVIDYGLDNLYRDLLTVPDGWNPVPLHLIDSTFLDLFPVQPSSRVRLPDPCDFDAYTGRWLRGTGCQLRTVAIDGSERAMCYALNADHVAFVSETDYLLNNGGRYPNSCFQTESSKHDDADDGRSSNERVLGQYALSWWNGTNFPDVGQVVNVDMYTDPNVRDRFASIYRTLDTDSAYAKWYADAVDKYNRSNVQTDDRLELRFGASRFYDPKMNGRMFIVYNVNPVVDAVSFDEARERVAFFGQIFQPFGVTGSRLLDDDDLPTADNQLVPLINVNDRTMRHVRLLAAYRADTQRYARQTDEEYRAFPGSITPVSGSNCRGSGTLLEPTVYLTYRPLASDKLTDQAGGRQWFASGPDSTYPATPSTYFCTTCPAIEYAGTVADAYKSEVPKMWPVVRVGRNRQLFPNSAHPTFDATVQVLVTTNFVVVAANGYSGNYLNYRSPGNVRRFFSQKPASVLDYTDDNDDV